ncbi:glycosyltransferase family 25 protein [Rhodobacteraceae bacterium B1Z28]|uniref:Glycosyltransferase family 25 protein n=1 Tax=Ruegeria haliotis TaxID=2747601 RepID=A0ABX2PVW5_9RHOB|nr:glycosyltransferase family 25 protein [Ruegeria haliotis]NVO57712.1 glycosyltransferase family 25 protein [Ruegeria haliotis]
MSIKAIILSLPKDVARRRSCESELAHLGLEHQFSDAIPGDQLEEADMRRIYDAEMNRSKFKRPLSRSEVACTLGHRQIWQKVAASEDHLCLVLEDDATFVQDPRPFLDAIGQCPECFEDVMIKLDGVPCKTAQVLKTIGKQNLILSDRLPPRTTGYILGRRAAARLVELDAPISRPVDIDLKFYWEHKVPILTLREQMVAEREAFDSNIEACRREAKTGSTLSRFVRNLLYQSRYTYGRLSHPLKPEMIEGLGPLLRGEHQVRNRI